MYQDSLNQHKAPKRNYSFVIASALTLLIAGVWVTISSVSAPKAEALEASTAAGPIEAIVEDIKMMFGKEKTLPPVASDEAVFPESDSTTQKEVYFDPEKDPGEFDGAVYYDHPRFKNRNQ